MQLFFGVLPAPSVCEELLCEVERARPLAPSVRWVRPANWHVTLSFLGQLDDERAALARQIAPGVGRAHAPFRLSFGGFGVFPHVDRPAVLWFAVNEDGGLHALADGLAVALAREGFTLDERPYHPHLTLARLKGRAQAAEVRSLLSTARPAQTAAFTVDRFVLFESRAGAYWPLGEWPLAGLTPATAP